VPGELPSPVSPNEQWKAIGFQQPKIESDLRGVGVLGLMQMAELATHFEAPFRAAIEREKARLPSNYPVAVGVIRVTALLCELMGVCKGMSTTPVDTRVTAALKSVVITPEQLHHLHNRLFLHLDREFSEDPDSSYMSFTNKTLAVVRSDLEKAVLANPGSVDELMAKVHEQRQARLKGSGCVLA